MMSVYDDSDFRFLKVEVP